MSQLVVEEWVFHNDAKTKAKEPDITDIVDTGNEKTRLPFMYVRDFRRRNVDQSDVTTDGQSLGFANHKQLGSFRIDGNQECRDTDCEPNHIEEDLDRICKMSINLMDGYDKSSLIKDYGIYKQKKWRYFLKWIQQNQYVDNIKGESQPRFAAFGGLFTTLMSTPNKFESWTILVTKYKNCIFMNKIRNEDLFKNNYPANRSPDRNSYLTAKVTQVITKSNEQSIKDSVNEFEKFFTIYETQIGSHQLLLLSELDAVDDEGNQYYIKCSKNLEVSQKWFNWWSNSVVSDMDYVAVGLKDGNDVLTQVKQIKVSELEDMLPDKWDTKLSLDFVNRFLDYVKNLTAEAPELEVFRVSFRKKFDHKVKSTKQRSQETIDEFVPEWFTSGDEWKQLMD